MPPDVIPLRQLIRRAGWAMVQPHRAFCALRPEEAAPYPALILTLLLGGVWFIFGHTRLVVGQWLWELYYEPIVVISYVLVSLGSWLLASHGLYVLSRWGGQPIALRTADIAAFYLWFVWALMPVFDVPHAFGLRTHYVIAVPPFVNTFNAHLSWLVAFPILCVQLYCALRCLCGVRSPGRAALAAGGLLVLSRFVIEPVFSVYQWCAGRVALQQSFWVDQYYLVGFAVVSLVGWRLLLLGRTAARIAVWLILGAGTFLGGSVWALQQPLVQNLNGPPPAPRVLAPVILEQPLSSGRRVVAIHPDVSWGPFWDGVDHDGSIVVLLRPTPTASRAPRLRACRVTVALLEDGLAEDQLPQLQCRLGVYEEGRFQEQAAGPRWHVAVGAQTYVARWEDGPVPTAQTAVAIQARVHGGGDYTRPDLLQIRQITLDVE